MRVKCNSNQCPWMIYASKFDETPSLLVKTFISTHECGRVQRNPVMNYKWLSKKYVDKFRNNQKWSIASFMSTVREEYVVEVSKSQLYRAKRDAIKLIDGKDAEQYGFL